MPFETAVTPFTGDANVGDFMENVWLAFARDDCKWAGNQAPSPDGSGSTDVKIWTHRVSRGGSPVAELSPYTPEAPYVFFETREEYLAIFTGSGIDPTKASYNQPGNPANYINHSAVVDDGGGLSYVGGNNIKCAWVNDLIGTYQAYWLFSDDEGRYVHCVVKVKAREYRHFHVGLLEPLHPDLDPESFYVTGHFWDSLNNRFTTRSDEADGDREHNPYATHHRLPFSLCNEGSGTSTLPQSQYTGSWWYIPGLNAHDWYLPRTGEDLTTTTVEGAPEKDDGGSPVNEGEPLPSAFGLCEPSGHGNSLGRALFSLDRTFTANTNSLIPIFVAAAVDFASLTRKGVVAQVPDVFRINMRDYAPEQEITVGADTYVVFPLINDDAANILDGEGYSAYEGLAYKKIDNGPVA